ncbi:MAG: hypothetical protein ABIL11_12325, partial [Chloroflexota bacterium]
AGSDRQSLPFANHRQRLDVIPLLYHVILGLLLSIDHHQRDEFRRDAERHERLASCLLSPRQRLQPQGFEIQREAKNE